MPTDQKTSTNSSDTNSSDGRLAFRRAMQELGHCGMHIFDVGARWGAENSWFRLAPLGRLIGFEPDAIECQSLNEKSKGCTEIYFPYALGRSDREAILHVTQEPACSSVFPPIKSVSERFPTLTEDMRCIGQSNVPLKRLDRLVEEEQLGTIDFIKLDTQGSELDILAGCGDLLNDCMGVEVEVMFSPLYEGQPLFADIDRYLRGYGFVLWRLENLAHYSETPSEQYGRKASMHFDAKTIYHDTGLGQLTWANAIYFKDRTQVVGRRNLLLLATLLEAFGDHAACMKCLDDLNALDARATIAQPEVDRNTIIAAYGLEKGDERRVRMTIAATDTDALPKIRDAGCRKNIGGTPVQILHNGLKIIEGCYHGPWMTAIIECLRGHHEPQEERAFHEVLTHLRDGAVMIELGSFWAYYSMWFQSAIPNARNIMIEPDPLHLAVGRRNFHLNGLHGEFLQGTVGRSDLPSELFVCESNRESIRIPRRSVDSLARQFELPRIDLLLSDIQGAELEMLYGIEECIAQNRLRFLFLSTHHHAISQDPLTHQKCLQFVRENGGHILAEHNISESFSGDGLIVASFHHADRCLPPIPLSVNRTSQSLFREIEYDLLDAYQEIECVGAELHSLMNRLPELAPYLNQICSSNRLLAKSIHGLTS